GPGPTPRGYPGRARIVCGVSAPGVGRAAGVSPGGSPPPSHKPAPPLSEATSFSVDLSPPRHPFSGADKQLPEAASQASQGAQVIGDAPAHPPAPSQASTVVQASWSSHVVPASAGVPPVHAPAAQLAPTRHGSPQAAPSGSS